ncbi:hypothetical protein PG996_003171 [Apiospora saccharicola]|uniref:Uncharacterized protein n=1 Tax=Apiospora saccharicola TaxID=335842 RepID=A0ABR1W341_9PEZI
MVGFSPPAVLSTLVVGATLAVIPLLVSLYKLPGDMVAGGCNSLVLSAACHAVRQTTGAIAAAPETDEEDDARRLLGETQINDEGTEESPVAHQNARMVSMSEAGNLEDDGLVRLARSKLRWGVTPLTPELRDIVQETGQEAFHLTFATEETFISPPVEGELYL